MSIFENLFSRSPFAPLQTHMEKVAACVDKLNDLFDAFFKQDFKAISKLSKDISDLEHSADLTKSDIKSKLPRGLFMAINRADLLQILSLQDSIADNAEDIAILLTLKKIEPIKSIKDELKSMIAKNIGSVESVHKIIQELDQMLESSFVGGESKRVRQMANDVGFVEHEVDIMQRAILKKLYNMEDTLSYSSFDLWMKLISQIAELSNLSENLGYKISSLIETN